MNETFEFACVRFGVDVCVLAGLCIYFTVRLFLHLAGCLSFHVLSGCYTFLFCQSPGVTLTARLAARSPSSSLDTVPSNNYTQELVKMILKKTKCIKRTGIRICCKRLSI